MTFRDWVAFQRHQKNTQDRYLAVDFRRDHCIPLDGSWSDVHRHITSVHGIDSPLGKALTRAMSEWLLYGWGRA